MSMFCFQCSETAAGKGCTVKGVCGKSPQVAHLQDLLIWVLKGISFWGVQGKKVNVHDPEADLFVAEGLFTTITNVNFDPESVAQSVRKALMLRDRLREKVLQAGNIPGTVPHPASWKLGVTPGALSTDELEEKGTDTGVLNTHDEDIRSLRELLVYGLKGIAAYTDHAYILQNFQHEILDFLEEGLAATLDDSLSAEELVKLVLKAGAFAVEAMKLLDKANTTRYGHPEITHVSTGTVEGPGILVSGHDLLDLEELLLQTQGTGVNVYTHGEMLPANAYPELKKYANLVGNYGTSWFRQQQEFDAFNGAIVMTTNCIQKPRDSYFDRIFTTGLVGWPGVQHIPNRIDRKPKDFSGVIQKAKELGSVGFSEGKTIPIGFAHEQVAKVADQVVDAVKKGLVKRFVVMAGCDGHANSREYYTDVAKALPNDTIILTAGCAKYRYNMLDLGSIGPFPRVLDAGQCNDSYSLVVTALKLKEAFGLEDINDLPISYDIAWYEQKAVAVLLALLYLGVKGIRLGPVLPAFVSEGVLKVLVEKFALKPIDSVENDVAAMMAGN
ncbi:MAG TPA: hydroxylamine reductase [Thermotogota bacterium]|nr:hydroxylamine reductase [Thermotogota bacterium]HRW91955.1 hydroxylamine reductase [Thermotogota bacterium]